MAIDLEKNIICCVCASNESALVFEVDGIGVLECSKCGHRYADLHVTADHVERVYGDDYFSGGGAGYHDYLSESKMLRHRGRRYAMLMKQHMTAGKLLDVGTAAGCILQGFADVGWQVEGIEPNASMAAAARERGLRIHSTTFEAFETNERYNLITMIQMIAHFVDPDAMVLRAAELLAPGGFCIIETWNRDSLTARTFGTHWHEYSPPSVLHFFGKQGVDRLCERHGLRLVRQGCPKKWIKGGHAKSLLRYKLNSGGTVSRLVARMLGLIPDNLSIPYPAGDLFWGLYQKVPASRD